MAAYDFSAHLTISLLASDFNIMHIKQSFQRIFRRFRAVSYMSNWHGRQYARTTTDSRYVRHALEPREPSV